MNDGRNITSKSSTDQLLVVVAAVTKELEGEME